MENSNLEKNKQSNVFTEFLKEIEKNFSFKSFFNSSICYMKDFKSVFRTNEKYLYIASLPLSIFLIHKLNNNIRLYILSFVGYFFYKGLILEIFPELTNFKNLNSEKREVSFIDKKESISNLFNGDVSVTKCNGYNITLQSIISIKEIQKKKDDLELILNHKIESIKRNPSNFSIVTIIVESKKRFRKEYPLSKYININIKKKGKIPFMLGIDKKGNPQTADLSKIHHMLISGDSGGGKTTCMNSTIQSMMYFNNNILYMFIDFKLVGFNVYRKFPNSIFVDSHEMFLKYLNILKKEMEKRYRRFANVELEDIWQYNNMFKKDQIPIIVAYIDEIADIRLNADEKELIESLLTSILGMGRGAGIHIIAATQRGSAVQLSTEVRAGLLGKLSFQIVNPQSQSMSGVKGTEKLKEGEFKTVNMGHENKILKGFYVDRVKEWEVYKQLKRVLIEGKNESLDFNDEIETKIEKKNKSKLEKQILVLEEKIKEVLNEKFNFLGKLKLEKFKKDKKPIDVIEKEERIVRTDDSVIKLIKELTEKNTESEEENSIKEENILLEYLKDNADDDGRLPIESKIEHDLNIKNWKLKRWKSILGKEGFLKLINGNYMLNLEKVNLKKE